ncbi:MAG: hypothetical protein OXI87_05800 [Albidovulum sp.]|nr:hypothetical protein [Albidovulum sp.]MDE0533759.1 hypothetical protein [Albidovulum sp.]
MKVFLFRIAAAAATIFAIAASGASAQEAEAIFDSLRDELRRISGREMPAAAAELIVPGENARIVAYPRRGELWLLDRTGARIADRGRLLAGPAPESVLTVAWTRPGREPASVDAAELARRLREGAAGANAHPAAECQDRIRDGGLLEANAGPLRAGWRIAAGSVSADGGPRGRVLPEGDTVLAVLDAGESRIPCAELEAALGLAGSPAEDRGVELEALILLLVDGNAALDRIAEYQERLRQLAVGDPAAARAARIGAEHCRDAAAAAVLCDRLVATFRQEDSRANSP